MGNRRGYLILLSIAVLFFANGGSASAAPEFTADPPSISFGERVLGLEYQAQTVYLDGTSSTPVTIESFEVSGANAGDFTLTDWNCEGSEVSDSSYCFFDVAFDPQEAEPRSASVVIEASSGDPVTIPVTGIGTEPAENAPALAEPLLKSGFAGASGLWGYAGGDFEGQGRTGVVAASIMSDYSVKAVFANAMPDGSLSAPDPILMSGGGFPGSAATGDFNGDGKLDAVAYGGGQAFLFLNEGNGQMGEAIPVPDDGNGLDGEIEVGDFTGDGFMDVVGGYPPPSGPDPYLIEVIPGEGDGSFGTPIITPVDLDLLLGLATGDFDDDGVLDLAAADYGGHVTMLRGAGDGTFTTADSFDFCNCASPWAVDVADFNRDGLDDVVATMRFSDRVDVFLAQPSGSFSRGQRMSVPGAEGVVPNPVAISADDLNGDRIPDLLVGNYLSDTGTIFTGVGDGTFRYASQLLPSESESIAPYGTYVGDFNGDQKPDPSIAGQTGDIAVFLNVGEPGQVPSPTSLDFGDQVSGGSSVAKTVTVSNVGGLAELRVSSVDIGGGDSNDFEIAGEDCLDNPVPVGGSCAVQVKFTPVGPGGSRSSALYLGTNHSSDTQISVPIAGTATDPVAGISVDPGSQDFGNVQVGAESAVKTIKVSSTGTAALGISGVSVTGSGAAAFAVVSNNCPASLDAGSDCSLALRFKPASAGAWDASAEIVSDAQQSPTRVGLSGNGTAAPVVRPPRVLVRKRPRATIRIRTRVLRQVRVAFRSDQAGSRFQCRIDRRKFSGCRSPRTFRNIRPGRHVIRIRAIKAGRTGPVTVIKFRVIRRR